MKLQYLFGLIILLLLIQAGQYTFAQSKPTPKRKPQTHPTDNTLPADPSVIIGKLPNGLTYYILKNAVPQKRAELYLVNKVGSILEADDQLGLAHFTEHMAFNGTKDYPKNELVVICKNQVSALAPI